MHDSGYALGNSTHYYYSPRK